MSSNNRERFAMVRDADPPVANKNAFPPTGTPLDHACYDIVDHGESGRADAVLAKGARYEHARLIVAALNQRED